MPDLYKIELRQAEVSVVYRIDDDRRSGYRRRQREGGQVYERAKRR